MFQFDAKWDVDTAAESLNTSLFGKSKKHKLKEASSSASFDKSYVSTIRDSDDEQYTKKDKKKMKKRRKKNKIQDKTGEISSADLNQSFDIDSKTEGLKMSVKTTKKSEQKKKIILSPVKVNSNVGSAKSQKIKKKSKHQDTKLNTSLDEKLVEKKSKKRKRSSESTDDVVCSKNKIAKTEKHENSTVANGDVAESQEGKKKRKRNRKKKKNSKKNKYKHLALNSKSKPENSDTPQDSGFLTLNLEPTKEKSIEHSPKKPKCKKSNDHIEKNKDISSLATLSDSAGVIKKQKANIDNHSGNSTLDSHVKSKSKKRKKAQEIDTPSIKKLKHGKNQSEDEAPKTSSSIHSANTTLKSGQVNSENPSISAKSKKKQQMLLKLLTDAQIKKQDSSNVKNKQNSTSDKGSKKIPLENGSIDKSKTSIKQGKNQEKILEAAQKKPTVTPSPAAHSIWGKAAVLGQQAKEKLDSARFRYINEQLYSCTGDDALKLFREDKTSFSVYHEGFQNQVNKWPVNPLDIFIKQIKDKPKNLVIADFGCGDAKLAACVPQKVHSFDLVALNKRITVCDMSKTPLPSEQVDIAIFCLSLMGTNIADFILEANRVLKTGGLLKIAEVVSRFSGLSRFIEGVCSCGFQLLNKRDTNQMFYLLDFKKIKPVKKSASVGQIKLKPCIYKRR